MKNYLSSTYKWTIRLSATLLMVALLMVNLEIADSGPKQAVDFLGMEVMISTNIASAFSSQGQDCDTLTGCTGPQCDGTADEIDVGLCTIKCSGGSTIFCSLDTEPGEEG